MDQAVESLSTSGPLGAVLSIIMVAGLWFFFKYYLPAQHEARLTEARLSAENQSIRDDAHKEQMKSVLEILEKTNQRHELHMEVVRREHGDAFDMQRAFFQNETRLMREHYERTVNKVCDALCAVEAQMDRNSIMTLAVAESQGKSRHDILSRVEDMTGDVNLKDKYKPKASPSDLDRDRTPTPGRKPDYKG